MDDIPTIAKGEWLTAKGFYFSSGIAALAMAEKALVPGISAPLGDAPQILFIAGFLLGPCVMTVSLVVRSLRR